MQIVTDGEMPKIPELPEVELSPAEIGIAVDIGTTTIAVSVWSLLHRKHLVTVAKKKQSGSLRLRYHPPHCLCCPSAAYRFLHRR